MKRVFGSYQALNAALGFVFCPKGIMFKTDIDQWIESRLPQIEYCRQNGLRPNKFTYWKIKLGKSNRPIGLVQVSVPAHCSQAGLKLNIGRELQLEITA